MNRTATSRIKVNPPLGNMPALQYLPPALLKVDPAYQRGLDTPPSRSLIRKITTDWNWDLCQPLVVARRENGDLYVIDGQHRLEAAKLRGDIAQLPAVVVSYTDPKDEAASFVHLNQQRRPLSKLDVFKAAVASGDPQSVAIVAAVEGAGLSIAPHSNHTSWKPGMISHIGGIEATWKRYGGKATTRALIVMAEAFHGQVLQYAGTLFPGIAAIVASELTGGKPDETRFERMQTMLCLRSQKDWRIAIDREKAESGERYPVASAAVMTRSWRVACGDPPAVSTLPAFAGSKWCDQCEMRVDYSEASGCKSRYCSLRKAA